MMIVDKQNKFICVTTLDDKTRMWLRKVYCTLPRSRVTSYQPPFLCSPRSSAVRSIATQTRGRQIRHGPSRLMFFPLMALACFYKDIHMLFFFFFPHPLNMLKSHLSTASPNLESAEARIMKLNEIGRFIYSRCVDLATLEVKCVYSSFPLIFGKPLAYHFRCFPPSLSCLFPLHLSICMKLGCLSSQGALIKKCGYEN